ncbi:hypothetical protein ABEB36_000005 [Hypothenemus hampei]|uniref:Peptidase metallopeptidase domain-containing protein n=1 Tax=Hypothenemus hampei TaxID=57062 RepID=A0ABD1F9Z2_HYPHA
MFPITLILLQNSLFIAAEVDIFKYLTQFGYLNVTQNSQTDISNSIAVFQEYFHLSVDVVANNETLDLMKRPRCGISDNPEAEAYSIGNRWAKTNLTWYTGYPVPSSLVRNVINEAFQIWQNVTNLNMQYDYTKPDIIISFDRLNHTNNYRCRKGQCSLPFDGKGSVLGHAFLPSVNHSKCLEIHLDSDENWYYGLDYNISNGYISLLTVLTHEIGHVLGLGHSGVQDAVMYPYYSNIKLKLNRIWIMDLETKKLTMKNLSIYTALPFLPYFDNISAVYKRPSGDIALVINKQLYLINDKNYKLKHIVNITNYLIPFNDKKIIGAVNTYVGKTIYFFSDNYYLILNECNLRVESYGYISKDFVGIPSGFDKVFRWTNGMLYFFQKDRYFEYNEFTNSLHTSDKFSLMTFGLSCPHISLFEQLKSLLTNILRKTNIQ